MVQTQGTDTEMANHEEIKSAVDHSLSKLGPDFKIRPKQLEAIINIINGVDTVAILPTSYGKSLIFRLLPSVLKHLKKETSKTSSSTTSSAIIVILVPLVSIIKDQVDAANELSDKLGLRACKVSPDTYQDVLHGRYNIIIGTPEAWLSERWKSVLSCKLFRKNVKCIVVDEVHKVSWGVASSPGEVPFREAFNQIGSLRSFCCENVPVLCLSATVDRDYCDLVKMSCSLSKNCRIVHACSDRPNIRLSIVKCQEKNVECFSWLFQMLRERCINCPKIIIYCRTQKLVGWLYEQFLLELKLDMFLNQKKSYKNAFVGMFHSSTDPAIKNHIIESITSDGGALRVVICTSALGCGVNCHNVKFVLHFGLPFSLVEYCQQIGRAGRSGEPNCHAVLYKYPQGGKDILKEMKLYASTSSCLRISLFAPFNLDSNSVNSIKPAHICCSFCSSLCDCQSEECKISHSFETINDDSSDDNNKEIFRTVSNNDVSSIEQKLIDMYASTISRPHILPSGLISGLTVPIIKEITQNLSFISSPHYIINNFTIVDSNLAENIFSIIKNHFGEPYVPELKRRKLVLCSEQYEFGDFLLSESESDE